jgi:hypothetical protein
LIPDSWRFLVFVNGRLGVTGDLGPNVDHNV